MKTENKCDHLFILGADSHKCRRGHGSMSLPTFKTSLDFLTRPVLIAGSICKQSQSRGVNLTPPGRELAGWERLVWSHYINQYQVIALAQLHIHSHTHVTVVGGNELFGVLIRWCGSTQGSLTLNDNKSINA